jgi:hypothetical protein
MAMWRRVAWTAAALWLVARPLMTIAAVCGDGVIDPVELCDDGAGNGVDGCCSTSCSFIDADADSLCDALDPCPSPASLVLDDVRLKITRPLGPPGSQTLRFRASLPLPAGVAIDPAVDGVRVVVSRRFYLGISLDVSVPGGEGWTASSHGWRFRDPSGLTDVSVERRGPSGPVEITLRGHGSYPLAPELFPAIVSLTFAPGFPATSLCGETHVGRGLCTMSASGATVSCVPPPELRPCQGDPDALVRCDLKNVASAEERWYGSAGYYLAGACTDVPGFVPSPGVVCTVAIPYPGFSAATAHPRAHRACIWKSVPPPGTRTMTCTPVP